MYVPRYQITNKILKAIGEVEAAKEVIENSPVVPSYEKSFKDDALTRQVHYGTHIEGNELSLEQTKKVLEGESIYAKPRDVQEVINYRKVVDLLEEFKNDAEYTLDSLLKIHATSVYRVVPEEKSGVLRTTKVIIKEEGTGNVIFSPPLPHEVPFLLEGFFDWLNSSEGKEMHPVLRAATTHYILAAVHPFVDGNGRAARAFTTLVLIKEGYDIKRFFALEERFDKDLASYYDAFEKVNALSENIAERDTTHFLEYFCTVLAAELSKIKERIRKISIDSKLKIKLGQQIALSERQMKLVEYMADKGKAKMNGLSKVLPMVSEDTILRDIKELMDKGIVEKRGKTKASRYILIQNPL